MEQNYVKINPESFKPNAYEAAYIAIPKVTNGSLLSFGRDKCKTILKADQHFNWFQKLMWKWCFGIKVEDYSDE